jgi:threonine/homoserine/homoserine lactone efflux protein
MDTGAAVMFQAMLVGLAIAAPVGPIGLLVIQRTLNHGTAIGLATGLGAAVADAAYGAIGAFGVTAVIDLLGAARVPLALGGSAFLLWLAWQTWRSVPAAAGATPVGAGGTKVWTSFGSTVLLTLANPATIVSFIAVFGALASRTTPLSPWTLVAGVLAGSALWWLLLSVVVGHWRSRFDAQARRWVNRVSALMLAGFAVWQWTVLLAGST